MNERLSFINGVCLLNLDINPPRFIIVKFIPTGFIYQRESRKSTIRGLRCSSTTDIGRRQTPGVLRAEMQYAVYLPRRYHRQVLSAFITDS